MPNATLAVVSDLHCGSTIGLCGPEPVAFDDGGSYTPSPQQGWLWEHWCAFWERVGRERGKWLGVLINGDAVDGDHHGTWQLVSRDPAVQLWILRRVCEPIVALKPDAIIIVRGTEAHVGKSGGSEEAFARSLKAQRCRVVRDPTTDMYSHWHFVGDVCGHLIDATHHGRIGQRPWTEQNAVLNLAAQVFYEHARNGVPAPTLAIRSHFHRWGDSYQAHPVRVIQTPAWQLATSYAHRVVPESLADIGGVLIQCETGRVPEVVPVLTKAPRPPTVRLV